MAEREGEGCHMHGWMKISNASRSSAIIIFLCLTTTGEERRYWGPSYYLFFFFFHFFRIALNIAKARMMASVEQCRKLQEEVSASSPPWRNILGNFWRSMEDVGPVGQSESLLVFFDLFWQQKHPMSSLPLNGDRLVKLARSAKKKRWPRGQKWNSPGEHRWRLGACVDKQRRISKAKVAKGCRRGVFSFKRSFAILPLPRGQMAKLRKVARRGVFSNVF